MGVFQIVGLGLVATMIMLVIKEYRPELAIQVSIAAGVVILLLVAGRLTAVIELLQRYAKKANIDMLYVTALLKIIGIAYVAEFGAEVCRDAGASSMASKIELAAKVAIVVLAVPIITSLLDLIIRIMP